jgi:hypothetical protein
MRIHLRDIPPTLLLLIGTLLICAGGWVTYQIGKPILDNAQASAHWPSVRGTIQTSRVAESRGSKGRRNYTAEVQYIYTVGDRSYSGNTVWFGDTFKSSSSSQARETVQQFRPGSKVPVYHDPERPAVAVLQPGVFRSSYVLYSLGWAVTGLGCIFNVVSMFNRRALRTQPLEEPATGGESALPSYS